VSWLTRQLPNPTKHASHELDYVVWGLGRTKRQRTEWLHKQETWLRRQERQKTGNERLQYSETIAAFERFLSIRRVEVGLGQIYQSDPERMSLTIKSKMTDFERRRQRQPRQRLRDDRETRGGDPVTVPRTSTDVSSRVTPIWFPIRGTRLEATTRQGRFYQPRGYFFASGFEFMSRVIGAGALTSFRGDEERPSGPHRSVAFAGCPRRRRCAWEKSPTGTLDESVIGP